MAHTLGNIQYKPKDLFDPSPLRRARLLKGWSLKRLAAASGRSLPTCGFVLAGQRANPATVAMIANALGVPIAECWRTRPAITRHARCRNGGGHGAR